jgi:NAD(P)-dependent dehydrogenase (short-subunit alcohol dehydrogenase family)
MLLKDRVAIITGGAKGMGKGMAVKFAGEGCSVAIADIAVKDAEDTAAEIKKKGGQAIAIKCDVTSGQQVKDAVDTVIKTYKKIDILVNNAGAIARHIPIEDMEEEVWDRVMALNIKSHFLFCKNVVPYMKKAKYGKIIGISSIGAVIPPAHEINYNTAKGAVISFTNDLATALAPIGINVNCILPGPIKTHFYDANIGQLPPEQQEAMFAMLGKKVPLQRIGLPEDMANAALFLASDMSSFITGQALYVAGGLPLTPPGPMPSAPPK